MWSSYALILLLKIYLGREQWCPSDKKYVNRHTLNCHIVLAIYQRCNSYSATLCQLSASFKFIHPEIPVETGFQTGFILSSVHLLFWIYLYMNIILAQPSHGPNPCHICVKCVWHSNDTLSRIPHKPVLWFARSTIPWGFSSKFSSFCSLFYPVFDLSTKCVGGALCHDFDVYGSFISYKIVIKANVQKYSHSNKPEFAGRAAELWFKDRHSLCLFISYFLCLLSWVKCDTNVTCHNDMTSSLTNETCEHLLSKFSSI